MVFVTSEFEVMKIVTHVLLCQISDLVSSLLNFCKRRRDNNLRDGFLHAKNALGVDFRLGACTVDPQSSAYDPRPLIPYLASLGVQYLYEEQPIMAQALAAGR